MTPGDPALRLGLTGAHTRLSALVLLLLVCLVDVGLVFAGTRRIAVIVANNQGLDAEEPLRYAEQEATELYRTLLAIGDVSPHDAYLLTGRTADEVTTQLHQLAGRVAEISQRQDVLVIFYYSGHASVEALHLSGTRITIAELKRCLHGLKSRTVIAFIDACKSGAFVRSKGIRRAPPFQIRLDKDEIAHGRVFITSSGAHEVSVEAESVRGSYFSHYLISGLRGDADAGQDGRVDLGEIYRHTYTHTVRKTAELRTGIQHPAFDIDLKGSGDVVITWPRRSGAGMTFDRTTRGTYLIIAKHGRQLMAEINKREGTERRIALPAETYIIKKRVKGGYRVGEVNLIWGGEKTLDESSMQFISHRQVRQKGVLPALSPNALSVSFDASGGVADGNPYLLGTTVSYHRDLGESFSVGAALAYRSGRLATEELSIPTHAIAVELMGAYRLNVTTLRASFGLGLGTDIVWQEVPARQDQGSVGFVAEVVTDIGWVFADPFMLTAGFRAGLEVLKIYEDYRVRPRLIGSVGIGVLF